MSATADEAGGKKASEHVVISRRSVFAAFVIAVGVFSGSLLAERLRLGHNSRKLKNTKVEMKGTNLKLKAEKDDYNNLFKQMSDNLKQWKSTSRAEEQKTRLESFKESSEALMDELEDVRSVLEEKEFQLWEKEGLLEYQEERLLDSEEQEFQMVLYINLLAQQMLALNLTLPQGLEEQPYYGQERVGHDPDADDAARNRRRGRRRALSYRRHLLLQSRDDSALRFRQPRHLVRDQI